MTLGVECPCATLRPAPASLGPSEREVEVGVEAGEGGERSPKGETRIELQGRRACLPGVSGFLGRRAKGKTAGPPRPLAAFDLFSLVCLCPSAKAWWTHSHPPLLVNCWPRQPGMQWVGHTQSSKSTALRQCHSERGWVQRRTESPGLGQRRVGCDV